MDTHHVPKYIALLCCLLLVVALVGVSGEEQQSPKKAKSVYVNVDRLMSSHPAWAELQDIQAASARLGKGKNTGLGATASVRIPETENAFAPDVDRLALEQELRESADRELQSVESRLRTDAEKRSLKQRAKLVSDLELDVAEHDRWLHSQTLESAAPVTDEWLDQQVNAQLKAIAVRQSANVAGQDKAAALARAEQLQAELDASSHARDIDGIKAEAAKKAELARFRSDREQGIDRELTRFNRREERRVSLEVSGYRHAVDRALASHSAARKRNPAGALVAEHSGQIQAVTRKAGATADPNGESQCLSDACKRLRMRIRRDMADSVKRIAAAENIQVTFNKSASLPDYTDHFAEAMQKPGVRTEAGKG